MTFLPIVERELRVAARKRGTFWLRVVAALVALVIGGSVLLLTLLPFGGRMQMGGPIFGTLTWLSLAGALSAGLFFTSDCLSEEKREGTLGFLFLTDLRGYDVVLGKLLATSLRCVFALLAIFPVLAITLMMGGVEVGQFWRTLLALSHALFFSLSVGMFVSALSRQSQKALAGTLLLLLLFVGLGPCVDSLRAFAGGSSRPLLSLVSPGYVFVMAEQSRAYWPAFLVSQGVAWSLLALACVLLPRTWQEKPERTSAKVLSRRYAWQYGGAKGRAALREKLLGKNPVMWLAARERWQSIACWTVSGLALGVFVMLLVADLPRMLWVAWVYIGGAFTLAFYLGTASQAGRFLVEARRSGLTELLLASPLTVVQITQGQWLALRRMFGPPVMVFLLIQLVAMFLSQRATWGSVPAAAGTWQARPVAIMLIMTAAGTLTMIANLIALSWFGMWMGLASKSTNLATLKTLLLVQIVPWFVISFVSSLGLGLLMMWKTMPALKQGGAPNPTNFMVWYPLITVLTSAVLSVAKDIFFVTLARRKLHGTFRESAALGLMSARFVAPPLISTKP